MIKLIGIGLIAGIFFLLQTRIYERLWNRNLKVDLQFEKEHIFEGESSNLYEIVVNQKRLPLSMLKVKFQTNRHLLFEDCQGSRTTDQFYRNDVFQVGGGEKLTRTLTFVGGKRGYYGINGVQLVGTDLFMTKQLVEARNLKRYLYVYPTVFDSAEFRRTLQQLNGEVLTKRHLLEDPFEYRGIREYQPYDDMRSVNWKATAKTGELKVNQKSFTALQAVRVFFNIEDMGILKKEECVEASFQIVVGLCEYFLGQGIRVSCYGNGMDIINGTPLVMEANSGKGQMDSIYRALARVDVDKQPVDFVEYFGERLLKEADGTITYLVAPNGYEHFVELLEQYQELGKEYTWFYPVWESKEPELPAQLAKNIKVLNIRK